VQEQVVTRHHAAGEEVPAHPVPGVAAVLEQVDRVTVTEVMHEQPAVRPEPARDGCEQQAVVADVLEHLDADDAVERPVELQVGDVRGDDLHLDAEGRGPRLDERLLRGAVAHGRDAGVGEALRHGQRQRTPAAPELQDVLPVGELGTLHGRGEHGRLRHGQVGALRPQPAGVLQRGAEHELVQPCRHLVVLGVGRLGGHDHRPLPQLVEERSRAVGHLRGVGAELVQSLLAQLADAQSNGRVGHAPALGES
jgi:hypothetical protein